MTPFFLQIPPSSDALDSLIIATILLFILSTITEKFTELVRMYPAQFRITGLLFCSFFYIQIIYGAFNEPLLGKVTAAALFLFNTFLVLVIYANTLQPKEGDSEFKKGFSKRLSIFNNVRKEKNDKIISEVVKEREVTALSLMIGLIVSFLFNANLFNFFDVSKTPGLKPTSPFSQTPPLFALDPSFFNISFVSIIGFILTAFFLSFGAKFFHDLLDNLLQIKNLKRKANERQDWEFNNISEFDQYIVSQENKLYDDFLNKQLNQPGVALESSDFDNKSVTVHVSDPTILIPEKLFYKTSLGKVWEIKIIKKPSSGIKTLGIPLFPSAEMANQIPYSNTLKGTLSYFVKALNSSNVYILTCYHVVWNGHDWDHFRPIGRENIVHPFHGQEIGEIYVALKNTLVDAVLIKPENISMFGEIEGIGKIIQDRALNDGDKNLTVRIRGNMSGNSEGYISELNKSVYIKYPDGNYKTLDNLILIKKKEGGPFSIGGDSGALLVDSFGFAIGMIVAGDGNELSYAIPFSNLRDQLNIEIYKTTQS